MKELIGVAVSIYENEIAISVFNNGKMLYGFKQHILIMPNTNFQSDNIRIDNDKILVVAVDNRRDNILKTEEDYQGFKTQDIEIDILGKKYKLTEVEPTDEYEY